MGDLLPDAKWLDALTLPAKVTGGLFAFFVISLVVDWKVIALLNPTWKGFFILGAILTGSLFSSAMIALMAASVQEKRKPQKIAERRKAVKNDQAREREERRKQILKGLDHLSADELDYVADALSAGSPAFTGYLYSGDLSNLQARNLLLTPGGSHNQDHYPFFFPDFVWDELVRRKDEFLSKDLENKRRIAEEEKRR